MFKGMRLFVIVVTLIVSLSLIFGIQYLVKSRYLEEPFKEKVLSIKGIEKVSLTKEGNLSKVYLTLASDVDLKDAYQQVNQLAKEMLKNQSVVEIEEKTNDELQVLYEKMHFSIYEAIANGSYVQMRDQLNDLTSSYQLQDFQVQVDNFNVYLKLVSNDVVFCKVISQGDGELVSLNSQEGGESQW